MTTARQWIVAGFGGPDVLQVREVEISPPGHGEVTITIRACGMNPADYKHFGPGQDAGLLPLVIGYEAAGVITEVGQGAEIATGGGAAVACRPQLLPRGARLVPDQPIGSAVTS